MPLSFDTTRKGYYVVKRPDGGVVSQHTSRDECYEAITNDGLDGTYLIEAPDREVTVSRDAPVEPPVEPPTDPEPPLEPPTGEIIDHLYSTAAHEDYDRAFDTFYARLLELSSNLDEQYLYEPAATVALQYLRTGEASLRDDFKARWEDYCSKIDFTGVPTFSGRSSGDRKLLNLRGEYLYRQIFGIACFSDVQVEAIGDHGVGGWTFLPYTGVDDQITERDAAAGLHNQVWAFAILGLDKHKTKAYEMIGHLKAWQDDPQDGIEPDGSFRHAISRHEGNAYPGNIPEDRGFSPWMTALVAAELYNFDVVFGETLGKEISLKLAPAMALAYYPAANDRRLYPASGNDYIAYLPTPYSPSAWADDSIPWNNDVHTLDMALLYHYGEWEEGRQIIATFLEQDDLRAWKAIDVGWMRAFGWMLKNGSAWID